MLLAFLSLTCGLILDTVTHGRREIKRMGDPPLVATSHGCGFAVPALDGRAALHRVAHAGSGFQYEPIEHRPDQGVDHQRLQLHAAESVAGTHRLFKGPFGVRGGAGQRLCPLQ